MSAPNSVAHGELCLTCAEACGQVQSSVDGPINVPNGAVMSGRCPRCRFLKYVQITPTCWLWTGTFYTQFGKPTYGQFWFNGRRMGAHVVSYLMHAGPIPTGLDCMHSCDTKACVNPAHLSPGTRTQNLLDFFAAHPGVCAGENNGRARLTWDDVHAIRAALKNGAKQPELARIYGVHQVQISHIARGTRWPESSCALHSAEAAA